MIISDGIPDIMKYDSSKTDNAYYVDELLSKYSVNADDVNTTFDSIFNKNEYFKGDIDSVTVNDKNTNISEVFSQLSNVKSFSDPNVARLNALNPASSTTNTENTCSPTGGSSESGSTGGASNASNPTSYFNPATVDFDVVINRNIIYNCADSTSQCDIRNIHLKINDIGSTLDVVKIAGDVNLFDSFCSDILYIVCMYNFKVAKDKILFKPIDASGTETIEQTKARAIANDIKQQTFYKVQALTGSQLIDIQSFLRTTAKAALDEIINQIIRKSSADPNYIAETSNFAKDFVNFNDGNNDTKTYYKYFKALMVNKMIFPTTIFSEPRFEVEVCVKKLLADIYIKTCYPMIHFDLMNSMMQYYASKGDFVNTRFALFAKSVFLYNIVNTLNEKTPSTVTKSKVVETDFYTILNTYYQNIRKIDMTNSSDWNEQEKRLLYNLHAYSDEVVKNSKFVTALSKSIHDNQISLKTVNDNKLDIERTIFWRAFEFYTVLSATVVIIVACSALLFFKKNTTAISLAGGYIAIIVLYQLILMIIQFVRKN